MAVHDRELLRPEGAGSLAADEAGAGCPCGDAVTASGQTGAPEALVADLQ